LDKNNTFKNKKPMIGITQSYKNSPTSNLEKQKYLADDKKNRLKDQSIIDKNLKNDQKTLAFTQNHQA
jgi:hypothetical protein